MSIEKKVERWAIRLDLSDPTWFTRVDAYNLNLQSNKNCVVGQAFGNFVSSPDARRFRRTWIPFWRLRTYMLTPHPFVYWAGDNRHRAERAWRAEILKRRHAPPYDERKRLIRRRVWVTKTEAAEREASRV